MVEKEFVLAELLPLFNGLSTDDQDSVRLLAIENCTAFSRVFNTAENNRFILPMVKACAGDKSWRVRNNVAKEFYAVRGGIALTFAPPPCQSPADVRLATPFSCPFAAI